MREQSRRAIFGTINHSRASIWHIFTIARATFLEIWHGLMKIISIRTCQKWHVNVVTHFSKLNFSHFFNKLINRKFQYCNPCCEVCGEKNPININRDRYSNTETEIYTNGNAAIFISMQE